MTAQTIEHLLHVPITAQQYDAMSEEQCRDIEIVDGLVQMSPTPTPFHNDVALHFANAIRAAGRPEWRTTTDVDLRLRDIPLLNRQPDVVVYRADTPRDRRIPVSAVIAVVEVVSPGSETTDRLVKPTEYAEAGIQYYWRVETVRDDLVVHTFTVDATAGVYRTTGRFEGTVKSDLGFPVEIDLTDI